MEAALGLFADRGYGAVAIEDIAEAAGVTKGAVYYWFADKDDLGRDLQHELYERLTTLALQALAPEGDAVTNMRRAFHVYLDALGVLGSGAVLPERRLDDSSSRRGRSGHSSAKRWAWCAECSKRPSPAVK